jgi:hypothetical protein
LARRFCPFAEVSAGRAAELREVFLAPIGVVDQEFAVGEPWVVQSEELQVLFSGVMMSPVSYYPYYGRWALLGQQTQNRLRGPRQ